MENELASNIKSLLTIKQWNECRMFTRINYLSKICNVISNELYPKIIKSRITWPTQPKSAETFWKNWINIVKQRYYQHNSIKLK